MSTMDHFEQSRGMLKTLGGIACLVALYAIASEGDIRDAERLEALREERAASLAASVCLPRPGQETRWQWQTADGEPVAGRSPSPSPLPERSRRQAPPQADTLRLVCEVRDGPAGYSRAPNVLYTAAPAGLDRLALFQGAAK